MPEEERLADHFAHHLQASKDWDRAMRLRRQRVPKVPWVLHRRLKVKYGADLPMWHQRPHELYLLHNALGVVIHPDTTFTGPAIVFHQVTLGNAWSPKREGTPTIGSHVFIGAGAKILGDVTLGDYSVIGANMVVTRDVPSGHVVSGYGDPRPIDRDEMLSTYFAYGRV